MTAQICLSQRGAETDMSRHNRDQQVQYIATESMVDPHPEVGSDSRIIDTENSSFYLRYLRCSVHRIRGVSVLGSHH